MTRYHGCDCAYCPVDPKDEEGGNPVSDLIEELTRQRDDARALAARSGVFQCAACESAGQVCCVCLLDEIRGGGS